MVASMNILMSIFIAALAALGAVGWTMPVPAAPPSYAIRLHFDGGGNVGDHLKFFRYIREANVPVQIDGDCVSACTLVLTLPASQVCIFPYGRLGFHLANLNGIDDPEITKQINDRFYPLKVLEWIKIHGPLQAAPIYLTGEEAIQLGVLPKCKP